MKNRIKLNSSLLKNRADVELTLREIAELTLRRNRLQTDLDEQITAIRERFEVTLDGANKMLQEKTELVRAWSEANPEEFGQLKSLDFTHAVIGFRTGQPTLKTITGWTWDRILEKLESLGISKYLRIKQEVNRQAILADRETLGETELRKLGLRVHQDESFFIEPKLTELDNRQQAAA